MADGTAGIIPKKHPGGRPPLYRPEFCNRIIELGKLGYSQARMAADIGVAKATINLWADEHPEFMNALTRARTYSQAWWEEQAQSGLANREFNAAIWDKSVKSMFRDDYTDRTITEQNLKITVSFEERLRSSINRMKAVDAITVES